MGYCMEMVNSTANFDVSKAEDILEAIKSMPVKEYGWVNQSEVDWAGDVKEAFRAWRWEINQVEDLWHIEFFEGEKLGDDELLWQTIAPFMNYGYIEMSGEDGELWRWVFKDGTYTEECPQIIWEYEKVK